MTNPHHGTENSGLMAEPRGTGSPMLPGSVVAGPCARCGGGKQTRPWEPSSSVATRQPPGLPHALDTEWPWVVMSEKRVSLLLGDLALGRQRLQFTLPSRLSSRLLLTVATPSVSCAFCNLPELPVHFLFSHLCCSHKEQSLTQRPVAWP